jgi:tripartite-type tricarboxylate transporter receptor subunit TctC
MAAAQRPEVKAAMEKIAFVQTGSTPEGLAAHTKEQYDAYRSALRAAGIEPE